MALPYHQLFDKSNRIHNTLSVV